MFFQFGRFTHNIKKTYIFRTPMCCRVSGGGKAPVISEGQMRGRKVELSMGRGEEGRSYRL